MDQTRHDKIEPDKTRQDKIKQDKTRIRPANKVRQTGGHIGRQNEIGKRRAEKDRDTTDR